MKAGVMQITMPMLARLLHLPEGVRVLAIEQSLQHRVQDKFEVVLEGVGLPEAPEGNPIPWVNCKIHTEWCSQDERVHVTHSEITE